MKKVTKKEVTKKKVVKKELNEAKTIINIEKKLEDLPGRAILIYERVDKPTTFARHFRCENITDFLGLLEASKNHFLSSHMPSIPSLTEILLEEIRKK